MTIMGGNMWATLTIALVVAAATANEAGAAWSAYDQRPLYPSYPERMYYPPERHYPIMPAAAPYAPADAYPYYYEDREVHYSPYSPYDMEPNSLQAEERAAREEALPVGQETWFEDDSRSRYSDVDAAFLRNLILSQMARDSRPPADTSRNEPPRPARDYEDEDVRELKALAGKPLYHVPKTGPQPSYEYESHDTQSGASSSMFDYDDDKRDFYPEDYPNDDAFINWGNKRSAGEAPRASKTASTTVATKTSPSTAAARAAVAAAGEGQKEVVQLRPATPVRHSFADPVMKMLKAESAHKKRSPTAFSSIKRLLSEDKKDLVANNRMRLQKRFVKSESDLVQQLKGLTAKIRV